MSSRAPAHAGSRDFAASTGSVPSKRSVTAPRHVNVPFVALYEAPSFSAGDTWRGKPSATQPLVSSASTAFSRSATLAPHSRTSLLAPFPTVPSTSSSSGHTPSLSYSPSPYQVRLKTTYQNTLHRNKFNAPRTLSSYITHCSRVGCDIIDFMLISSIFNGKSHAFHCTPIGGPRGLRRLPVRVPRARPHPVSRHDA